MDLFLRVVKNSAFLAVATLLDRAGEYVLVLYISRTLGVLFFGEYHLVISLLVIFQNLANFGLIQLVTREVAKRKDQTGPLVLGYSLLGSGLSLVLMGALYVTAAVLDYPPETMLAIYVVGLSILPGTLRAISDGAIFAWERMELVALMRFFTSLVRVGAAIALLWLGYGLIPILAILVISQWLGALLGLATVHRVLTPLGRSLRGMLSRQGLADVGTFFVMSIFLVGANNVDAVILSKLAAIDVVGLYGAATKLVQAIILIRPSIMHSLFPTLSYLAAEAPSRFQTVTEQALKVTIVVLSPIALIICLSADEIIPFLYTAEFMDAVAPLQVLIWVIVPSFAYAILTRTLVAGDHEKPTIIVAALSMAVNVGLDLLLIPRWGSVGAAWATVASMTLAAVVTYVMVCHRLFQVKWGAVVGRPALGIVCLGALAFLLRGLPWAVLVLVLPPVYVLLLFLLQITRPDEWLALWQALRKRVCGQEVRV